MILINSSPQDALKIFQPFLPIFVPVGVGYLLAAAEQEGIRAWHVDEQIEADVCGAVEGYLQQTKPPYIFGFSVLTAALKNAVAVSAELKRRYPDSVIVFGGIHPTAVPDEVLSFPHVDAVIRGEGESLLIEFYRAVKEGRDFAGIKGLSYRKDGRVIHNERPPTTGDLSSFPVFPYHRFTSPRYDLGFVVSSRGCPYNCIFCSNRVATGKRYRVRPAEMIVEELVMLYEKHNRRNILFLDDNFLVSKQRVYELLEKIREAGLENRLSFSFQARGDNVDAGLLRRLYDSGFRSVFFGLETASEDIMKIIKKGETVEQCVAAVRMAKEIGFHVSATFIYGLPSESHRDRMDCVRMSTEIGLDMVRFNNATPYPGTELYEIAKREGRLNIQGLYENFVSVSTFIENPFRPIPFTYVPEGSTEAEIRRDILFSYYRYYLDFGRLRNIFARPDLGVGWFNAGGRIWEFIRKLPALFSLGMMLLFKFGQLFHYMVIRKDTRLSLSSFLRVFDGLVGRRGR